MVLSETRARRRGLTLVLVIREGLWLGECLGELPAKRIYALAATRAQLAGDV